VATRDGRHERGIIAAIDATNFTTTDGHEKATIDYSDVLDIRPSQPGWKTTLWMAIGAAGALVGALVILTLIACGDLNTCAS
jgi:hypothetical protein